VVPWGSANLFAGITGGGAAIFVVLAFATPRLGRHGATIVHYGPWFIAIGVWFALWELTTAKFGWLPKPFFSPPNGLLNVYVTEAPRLLICIAYTLRLWSLGFVSGVIVGYIIGIALGWSKRFSYWGMPILKLIGPVPATAWIPCTFFFFPTTFAASVFIVALATGIPVTILTSSGVASVDRAYYDVGRNLGASDWYLISKIAAPASLPHVFVGLFMGLYYSFAVLVVAEMLGAKFGLGWYIQFQTAYSGYANVYATLIIMALICAGIVKLLFVARDRLLNWQKGFI
jgi:NitT/TauT family transport system permease protein